MQKYPAKSRKPRAKKHCVGFVVLLCCYCGADYCFGAKVINLAPAGVPLLGAGANLFGTDDRTVANQGQIGEVNDGVINSNLSPNGFQIDTGNGVDTFGSGNAFDFVGVLFPQPQFGVSSVRVQNYLANDGGWWGPTNTISGGAPLTAGDLTSPLVQVTTNGGATWTSLSGVTSDYISQYTGAVRGTGFPDATSGPLATFSFAAQNSIDGIRLVGNGAGPADGNGFIGVNEFEVSGIAQELSLEVNTTYGQVRISNEVQSGIALDFYQITSAADSLNLGGWNSLENPSDNPAGFPNGDGSGNGWEVLANSGSGIVAEAYLQGSSAVAPDATVNLGFLFDGETQDLHLRYRTSAGQFVDVSSVSIAGLPGDFDWDEDVDGADFLAWQRGLTTTFEAADVADWQANYGMPLMVAVGTVPEPSTVALLISAAAIAARRTVAPRCGRWSGQPLGQVVTVNGHRDVTV